MFLVCSWCRGDFVASLKSRSCDLRAVGRSTEGWPQACGGFGARPAGHAFLQGSSRGLFAQDEDAGPRVGLSSLHAGDPGRRVLGVQHGKLVLDRSGRVFDDEGEGRPPREDREERPCGRSEGLWGGPARMEQGQAAQTRRDPRLAADPDTKVFNELGKQGAEQGVPEHDRESSLKQGRTSRTSVSP